MMKRTKIFLFAIFTVFSMLSALAQELAPIYSARAYWLEQQNPRYKELILRQLSGDSIKAGELEWLTSYRQYLESYYAKLNEQEKQVYKDKSLEWDQLASGKKPVVTNPKETDQYNDVGDRSIYSKYLVQAGYFGFYYGATINAVFDIGGATSVGIPFLAAGTSVLIPMLNPATRRLSSNSLMLSVHGKTVGWMHGFALSNVLLGSGNGKNDGKIALTISALSSIGLGYLGRELGKNKNWTEGRIAMYRYYGLLAPFTGASILLAANVNDNRLFGAGIIASGLAGYYLADRISNKTDYTRGDVLSMKTLSILNGSLGLGIWLDGADAKREASFLPALGAISGTLLSQYWLRNYKLTVPAARKVIYATIGGSLIGEGFALIINSDSPAPYYVIPWITGFVSYTIAVESFKSVSGLSGDNRKGLFRNWTADFQPENLIIGSKMTPKNGASPMSLKMQPPPALTLRYTIR